MYVRGMVSVKVSVKIVVACLLLTHAAAFAGLVVDSLVFLWLAFDDFSFLGGQIIGKIWMVLIALPLIALLRRRDERIGLQPV